MEKRKITDAIVVHCSATPEGREHDVTDIRRWHKQRGFSDVGYHFVVKLDGTVEKGREEYLCGAHCVEGGMNRRSIGVCYIGGMDKQMKNAKDTRTPEQKESLRKLVRTLQQKYDIPDSRVFGHRDFSRKACPCFDVRSMLTVMLVAVICFCSCTRRVYVPLETTQTRVDTVRIVQLEHIRESDKDTVRIRERGDTVFMEVARWRWRDREVHDTVREILRDTIRKEVAVPVEGGSSTQGWKNRLFIFITVR